MSETTDDRLYAEDVNYWRTSKDALPTFLDGHRVLPSGEQ